MLVVLIFYHLRVFYYHLHLLLHLIKLLDLEMVTQLLVLLLFMVMQLHLSEQSMETAVQPLSVLYMVMVLQSQFLLYTEVDVQYLFQPFMVMVLQLTLLQSLLTQRLILLQYSLMLHSHYLTSQRWKLVQL